MTPNCTNPNTEFLPQYLARVIVGYTLFFIAIVGNVLTLIPLVANIKRMPIYRKEVILYDSYNMIHIFDQISQNLKAKLTRRGFRVLAMAEKEINLPFHKIDKADRSDCETDLNFLGLLIMQNQLKPKSEPILNELTQAGIR